MTTLSGQHGKEYLLTAFLNLPVEEEVSIKTKYNAYYLNKVSKPDKISRIATAMQESRYSDTCQHLPTA